MSENETQENYKADLEARVKGFNEKLIPLLKEFKLALGATPRIAADGRIIAVPQLFDDSKKSEPAAEASADSAEEPVVA